MTNSQQKYSTSESETVIRLTGPAGLVIAVPEVLGFHPHESIVVMCFGADRGRITMAARLDIADIANPRAVADLVTPVSRNTTEVSIVCYHSGARPREIDAVVTALSQLDISVSGVLSVSCGKIRDARTQNTFTSDPGIDVPDDNDWQRAELRAAAAYHGRTVLPSRQAIVQSIAAPADTTLAAMRLALISTAKQWTDLPRATQQQPSPWLQQQIDKQFAKVITSHQRSGKVEHSDAAALIMLSGNRVCRDWLLSRIVSCNDPHIVPVLIAIAALTPVENAPSWCALLAYGSFYYGDGVLALCALERSLGADPDYRLSQLLLAAIQGGLAPRSLSDLANMSAEPFRWDRVA